jgi:hypothetical protein
MILALVGLEDDLRFASLAHVPPEGAPEIAKAGAAVFNDWRKCAPAAAIPPDSPGIVEGIAPRPDVEDTRGAQTDCGGRASVISDMLPDQRGIEERTEATGCAPEGPPSRNAPAASPAATQAGRDQLSACSRQ